MPTTTDVRNIALAMDGASEVDHWGRPGYRQAHFRGVMAQRHRGLLSEVPGGVAAFTISLARICSATRKSRHGVKMTAVCRMAIRQRHIAETSV
jgi:hypothetical protein